MNCEQLNINPFIKPVFVKMKATVELTTGQMHQGTNNVVLNRIGRPNNNGSLTLKTDGIIAILPIDLIWCDLLVKHMIHNGRIP